MIALIFTERKKNCVEGWLRNNISKLTGWRLGGRPTFDTQRIPEAPTKEAYAATGKVEPLDFRLVCTAPKLLSHRNQVLRSTV
jgi:hypothetical protein